MHMDAPRELLGPLVLSVTAAAVSGGSGPTSGTQAHIQARPLAPKMMKTAGQPRCWMMAGAASSARMMPTGPPLYATDSACERLAFGTHLRRGLGAVSGCTQETQGDRGQ